MKRQHQRPTGRFIKRQHQRHTGCFIKRQHQRHTGRFYSPLQSVLSKLQIYKNNIDTMKSTLAMDYRYFSHYYGVLTPLNQWWTNL